MNATRLMMLDIHKTLGRELDPIEDVRRGFEMVPAAASEVPDSLSDAYYRVIDFTTQPGQLSERDTRNLHGSINYLNEHYGLTVRLLGGSSLLGAYTEMAEGVNAANGTATDPARAAAPRMMAAPLEEVAVSN